MRAKHPKDQNNGKRGMICGNPRYRDKGWGLKRPTAATNRSLWKKETRSENAVIT